MALRFPFFGIISTRSPLAGLLEHYEQIAKGLDLIEESISCYVSGDEAATCKEFNHLLSEVNEVEAHADTIKRYIHNRLPRGIFLPIDKHLFFDYTRNQDYILNEGQESLQWLSLHDMHLSEEFKRSIVFYLAEACKTVRLLKPALESTINWLSGQGNKDREEIKNFFRDIRKQHKTVTLEKQTLISKGYKSDMDFKDIYLLIHYAESLHEMSHQAEICADMLRAMIAR